MRGVCFVHVLFHHVAKRPNGRLAQVLGTPVKFPSDSRAIAIPWHRSSSSQKALWCRGALRVGGVRWAVEVFLGLSLKLLFCNPFLTSPKPDLLQLSLPQPGHQHLLHCALRLGSFGTSWITCTSLIPWATSCSPKTAFFNHKETLEDTIGGFNKHFDKQIMKHKTRYAEEINVQNENKIDDVKGLDAAYSNVNGITRIGNTLYIGGTGAKNGAGHLANDIISDLFFIPTRNVHLSERYKDAMEELRKIQM